MAIGQRGWKAQPGGRSTGDGTSPLMSAVPYPDPDIPMNFDLRGEVADPANLPPGCAFHPRCDARRPDCRAKRPALRPLDDGRTVACHLYAGV